MSDIKSRDDVDILFQAGFDYAHSQAVGHHSDEVGLIDPANWPTIAELVEDIVEHGVEEIVINIENGWDIDILRGVTCYATTMRHEIYFYMTDHGLFDVDYPQVVVFNREDT